MPVSDTIRERFLQKLSVLYPEQAAECMDRLETLIEQVDIEPRPVDSLWDQRDAVLITYGDQVRGADSAPLSTLHGFLGDAQLDRLLSTVHILPFFPFTSDDGFSVSDYRQVDPELGDWDDVARLADDFDLMFDLVLNHCSQEHCWFQGFLAGDSRYRGFFHDIDPSVDLSQVTRPRSTPLLTPYETARGTSHVWTTFSADQVDLNFSDPEVLLEMCGVLLDYVRRGARIIRLDAIAYLWKEPGTSCIHLPQTHLVVKLMRDLLDAVSPGCVLLTETNVPHAENVSYFGDGDEARMVYQFSLAPLLLDAFLSADAGPLTDWLSDLEPCAPATTFFNFTASHDGIGVRPLEGLVAPERLDRLVEAVTQRGGRVSTKRNPDGTDSPYELNITYFSALGEPGGMETSLHVRRFLSSQAVMLALRGIPGIYFHSLVGTPNDLKGMSQTGRARSINRRKYEAAELQRLLADPQTPQTQVFAGYRRLLEVRRQQPAFHPDADQRVIRFSRPELFGFERSSSGGGQRISVITNVSGGSVNVDAAESSLADWSTDLITGEVFTGRLLPYQTVWLSDEAQK